MAKLAPTSIKYVIRAKIKAKGIVEKPDVIGAVFGQTEGLLGSELDLRELQRTGRIGRIDVDVKTVSGNSEGEITIPSSLDSAETALIAAAIETIERVGPCTAEISVTEVEDTRSAKRDYVMDRAKSILKNMMDTSEPETSDVSEKIKESVRTEEVTKYKGNAAGPDLLDGEDMVIVEGRADVITLLKYGINNAVAMGGTSLPQSIADLTKEKTVTVFTDGDRGGDLIIKECLEKADIDFVAKAPEGKEVEELTKKEVHKALRDRMPVGEYIASKDIRTSRKARTPSRSTSERKTGRRTGRTGERRGGYRERRTDRRSREERPRRPATLRAGEKELFRKTLDEIVGSKAACIFSSGGELLGKVPIPELESTLRTVERPLAVVVDGKVNKSMEHVASRNRVKFLVGTEKENIESSVRLLSKEDLK